MSEFTEDRNIGKIYSFKTFSSCAHHLISIPVCVINFLFFSKKLSIKDMDDFPVPTQDVTGDDKQGMKIMRFLS